MLTELSIRDFALIEEAELHFGPGLNAITGETGAGKSLLVGSLELLLGERPRGGPAAWVRQGAVRARVEGRFLVPRGPVADRVAAFLAEELPAAFEDWQSAWRDLQTAQPRNQGAGAAALACAPAKSADKPANDRRAERATGNRAESAGDKSNAKRAAARAVEPKGSQPAGANAPGQTVAEVGGAARGSDVAFEGGAFEGGDFDSGDLDSGDFDSGGLRGREVLEGERMSPGVDAPGASHGGLDSHEGTELGDCGGPPEVELILGRTLELSGRSRAHVNHIPVTAKALRGLALLLIELHGQNAHQRLLEPGHQLELLDAFAGSGRDGSGREFGDYGRARQRWRALESQLRELEAGRRLRADRAELLRFQVEELAELNPKAGEHQPLLDERERLRHASELARDLAGWIQGLSEADGSALDRLRGLERSAMVWAGRVRALEGVASELLEARLRCEEALSRTVSFADGLEIDPERLEAVENRLEALERLGAKHGVPPDELAGRTEELQRELLDLEDQSGDEDRLRQESAAALILMEQAAQRLTRVRRGAAARLGETLAGVFPALGLPQAKLVVELRDRAARCVGGEAASATRFAADGADEVEYLFAANPGEELKPLRHVASGGETARVVLALRSVLAGTDTGRTLIFDEIDTGVGGRLAPELARHLRGLGAHHQVLTVTHLPPIAAASHRHLKVAKAVVGGRTETRFEELIGEARVAEIADMLSGGARQATARAEAKRLLNGAA
jgi:DNA repair protein RecN (Recombination protein N)